MQKNVNCVYKPLPIFDIFFILGSEMFLRNKKDRL